eukprot:COSAG04_NODE_7394_length_1135_cov_1.576255_1_plen_41_part_10
MACQAVAPAAPAMVALEAAAEEQGPAGWEVDCRRSLCHWSS